MKILIKTDSVIVVVAAKSQKLLYIYLVPFIIVFCLHVKAESGLISKHPAYSNQVRSEVLSPAVNGTAAIVL